MNILAVSDTHLKPFKIQKDWVGHTDLILHCGDLLNNGSFEEFKMAIDIMVRQMIELKCSDCLISPGNHDKILSDKHGLKSCDKYISEMNLKFGLRIALVVNSVVKFGEFSFFMSPINGILPGENFQNYGFQFSESEIDEILLKIMNEKIDILVTHGPPFGILDMAINRESITYKGNRGNRQLLDFVLKRNDIRLHLFGHAHLMGGNEIQLEGKKFCNVAKSPKFISI